MFDAFYNRQPGRSWRRILWWHFLHFLCFVWFWPCYRFRAWGVSNVPATGPVLLVSNHQSFLDPITVGLAAHHRQFYAMARASLWKTHWLGWLIDSLNAVPVAQGEGDLKAMRRCLEVLKTKHALLIFPEGSRSETGVTQPFEPGTMLLIKRSKAVVVPVALEGAQHIWPRSAKLPRFSGRIGVQYGRPIPAEALLAMGGDRAIRCLRDTVESMRLELAERLQRGEAIGYAFAQGEPGARV